MYFEICSGNVRKWYDQRRVCKAFLCIKLSFFTRRFQSCKNRNVGSLHCLVASGVIKLATAENIAGSGLNLQHLKLVWQRDGEDGIRNIFTAKNRTLAWSILIGITFGRSVLTNSSCS